MSRANSGRFLMPVVLMFALAACTPKAAQVDSAADNAALLAAAETFNKAYNDKNADAVAAIYTTDAELLPPDAPAIVGRSGIREHYANDIANAWVQLTITTGESGTAGDWGWRSGTWSVATEPVMTGKYVEVWRRASDGWQMYRDIWNGDAPMPAPPPSAPATTQ